MLKPSAILHLDELIKRFPNLADIAGSIKNACESICDSYKLQGKVLVCGNGGSAADSEHIVGELMKGFLLRREMPVSDIDKLKDAGYEDWKEISDNLQQGIPAIALTGHVALSTAVLNDNHPYIGFAQQVYAYGKPEDVLIGISTSGGAKNVIYALKTAKAFGLKTIGFTGKNPSAMDEFCDVIIKVPETQTYKVQELHLPIYHTICIVVEEELFGE